MSGYDDVFAEAFSPSKKADPYDAAFQSALPKAESSAPSREKPVSVAAGQAINSIPRQLGLTARYALEGPANALQIVSEPMRYLTDKLVPDRAPTMGNLVTGQPAPPKSTPLGVQASKLADWIGLPKPEGANERVTADATRLMSGTGVTLGAGALASQLSGWAGRAGAAMSANGLQQLSGAAGAGLASGASREAGGGAVLQAVAGALGGVGGMMAPGAVSATTNLMRRAITPAMDNAQIDATLTRTLATVDTDYAAIPEAARRALRTELRGSLQAGKELDPQAVRRFADFAATGTTPTRGMVTLDPVQITREQNLSKMAANGSDGTLQGLPRMQNENNTTLIRNLNDAGAARGDIFGAGQGAIGRIAGKDASLAAGVTEKYNAARAMPGGDVPLDRAPFVNGIFAELAKQNKTAFLPESVSNMLNTISKGTVTVGEQTHNVPFDANTLDNLLTVIATEQRATSNGNIKAALSAARKAIDSSPLGMIQTGSASPVTGAGAAAIRGAEDGASAYMGALNEARSAAASRFNWREGSRPIEAAVSGMEPDGFFKKFVLNGTVADTKALAAEVPVQPLKEAFLAHLKERSLNKASDEVGKFSQSAYNKALTDFGDRKLSILFSPDEIEALRANGRVASYMMVQPVGSAVNNSNSGALVLGRGADLLTNLAKKIPAGKLFLADPLESLNVSLSNRQAQNVLPGLLAAPQRPQYQSGLLAPGIALGGLLAAPGSP